MADPTTPADPVSDPVEPVPTSAPAPAVEPAPAAPSHDPYLLRSARDLQITDDEIASYSPSELQQAVYHRTRALASFRQPAAPYAQPTRPEPVPDPEPDLGLSPSELTELQELNPVLAKAFRANAKAAHEAKRVAQEQAEAFRRQQHQSELARQVNEVMTQKYAAAIGVGTSSERSRKNAVIVELAQLAQQGVITDQTPPEFAVAIAVKNLFGPVAPAAPVAPGRAPVPPSVPVPTPTARPTSRHGGGEEGDVNTIDDLIAAWDKTIRQSAVAEAAAKDKNGEFRP